MLGSPRIIAIDDDEGHLSGLADCLNENGIACLRIHFTGDPADIAASPDVRIVFADLHLGAGSASDHKPNFSMIGGLLRETIRPSGPYFIILWTRFPEEAAALREFLDRLGDDVAKPFDVQCLRKADHLDAKGGVRDAGALIEAIVAITRESPQLAALFDWESRVLGATGRTVSSILDLPVREGRDDRASEVARILSWLAVEAAGKANVEADPFRAVNEALLPILADRIAKLRSEDPEEEPWRNALERIDGLSSLSVEAAARLNRLVHIAETDPAHGTERGVVVSLPGHYRRRFQRFFGLAERAAAKKEFRCTDFESEDSRFRWVLVQCQAACDHAQSSPGTLPFYLGLDFPHESKQGKPPASTWRGPAFRLDGRTRVLRVGARFPVALARSYAQSATPVYRLREQMLNQLIHHVHAHGARPGMIEFRGK